MRSFEIFKLSLSIFLILIFKLYIKNDYHYIVSCDTIFVNISTQKSVDLKVVYITLVYLPKYSTIIVNKDFVKYELELILLKSGVNKYIVFLPKLTIS